MIVVSYNTVRQLYNCLHSLDDVAEIIVVDNASRDGSPEMVAEKFPHVRLFRQEWNLGFGAANNIGLAAATQPTALLLNSDCVAEPGAVRTLLESAQASGAIAAGGMLLHEDGKIQKSCCGNLTLWRVLCEQFLLEKFFWFSRTMNGYWLTRWLPRDRVSPVAQVMGACLLMPSRFRFDERFFLYCEDTELCHRLSAEGPVVWVPMARFQHELGASSKASRWWSIAMYNRGKELYFQIHGSPAQARIARLLNRAGAACRLAGWALLYLPFLARWDPIGANVVQWWKVLRCPPEGPPLPDDAPHDR